MVGILTKAHQDRVDFVKSHFENILDKGIKKCMHTNVLEGKCVDCGKEILKKDDPGDGGEEDIEESVEKAIHNLFGDELDEVTDPIDKAFVNILEKGGEGSNKAGRVIGTTRSGKPVHSLKGAHEYKDFEAVDHEEAYKIHMNHGHKVQGVAAVNSRIRAHDHGDQAQIKAAKQEQEEIAAKTAKGSKEIQAKEKAKQMKAGGGAAKKPAAKKKPVKKGEEDELEKGEIFNTFTSTYGDKEPLRFSKSGKEIIFRLKKLHNKLDGEIMDLEGHMENEEDIIGFAPDSVNNSYAIKGKGIQTMRYSYDCCYGSIETVQPKVVEAVAIPAKQQVNVKQQTIQQACNRYNDYSSQLLSSLEDVEAIRLMIDNLESGKKYSLSVTQLAALGF